MARGDSNFGQAIRDRKRQLGLTQTEVAKRIGGTSSHIGSLENGKRYPSLEVLTKLARALGFDVVDLLHLANPQREALLAPETTRAPDSVWKQFRSDESLIRIHKITNAEMEMLSYVALLGEFRSPRDIIHVLNVVRYVVAR
jgi:transcriptional regulator with XRE-family HTH domain